MEKLERWCSLPPSSCQQRSSARKLQILPRVTVGSCRVSRSRRFCNAMRHYGAITCGLSSKWWSEKHNLHHAFTNVVGVDEDIMVRQETERDSHGERNKRERERRAGRGRNRGGTEQEKVWGRENETTGRGLSVLTSGGRAFKRRGEREKAVSLSAFRWWSNVIVGGLGAAKLLNLGSFFIADSAPPPAARYPCRVLVYRTPRQGSTGVPWRQTK